MLSLNIENSRFPPLGSFSNLFRSLNTRFEGFSGKRLNG